METLVAEDSAMDHKDVSVKMRGKTVRLAKAAAGFLGLSLIDFLENVVEPAAKKVIDESHAEMHRQDSKPKRKGGKEG
jgi:uncharacterized protein (DUF1778 family)